MRQRQRECLSPLFALIILIGIPMVAGCGMMLPAELWVIEQVNHNKVADLAEFSNDEADRRIRASVLHALFTKAPGTIPAITVSLDVVHIRNATVTGTVNVSEWDLDVTIFLTDCQFPDGFSAIGTRFKRSVFFSNCTFSAVECESAVFRGRLFLRDCTIKGTCNFRSADIAELVVFDNSKFLGAAQFERIRCGELMQIVGVEFADLVSFAEAKVKGSFDLTKATCRKGLNLVDLNVGGNVSLHKALISGPLFGSRMQIGGDFLASEIRMEGDDAYVYLSRSIIGGAVSLQKAEFTGSFFLEAGEFEHLVANECRFKGTKGKVSFAASQVNGYVNASGIICQPSWQFARCQVSGSADFTGSQFEGGASFQGTRVDEDLNLTDCSLGEKGRLLLDSLQVDGTLNLKGIECRQFISLDGTRYSELTTGNGDDEWRATLAILDRAPFSQDAYLFLEEHYRRKGKEDLAQEIGRAREYRKQAHLTRRERAARWLAKYGLLCLSGFLLIAPIAVGCSLAFSPRRMTPTSGLTGPQKFSRFWYTVDVFLPGVDLGLAKNWSPNPDAHFSMIWQRWQMVIGWFLIPILIGALVSLLRLV